MSGRRARVIGPLVAVALTLGSMALADVVGAPEPEPLRAARPTFRVRGNVKGLYPGHVKKMRLRVRNPFDFAIRIHEVRARARRPFVGCPAKAVKIRRWHGNLKIAPHSRRIVNVRIRMKRWAPNACQGARFPIRYRGEAVRA
jgi:hypothetical protein